MLNKKESMKNYIKKYTNVLDKKICNDIIENCLDPEWEKAKIMNNVISSNRNCYQKLLHPDYDKVIHKCIGDVLQLYKQSFRFFENSFVTTNIRDTGYGHLLYKGSEKGEYKIHIDHYDENPRILSCSVILNDDYKGGDFCFFENEDKFIVEKEAGSVVVFPSNFCFPHAITPVFNGNRHSIITWIY